MVADMAYISIYVYGWGLVILEEITPIEGATKLYLTT